MADDSSLDHARQLDGQDPLSSFRDQFVVNDPQLIYLDGNSLGRLPKRAVATVQQLVAQQWGNRLIRAWNEQWIDLPARLGAKIAQLLGVPGEDVIVADSTSVNFFKLTLAALKSKETQDRTKIVTDDLNFPTDLYVLGAAVKLAGAKHRLEIIPSPDGLHGPATALAEAIDPDTALVALSHTAFKSGYVYDLAALTAHAHDAGALALWDVSHSVGAMPLDLAEADVDLAVGCTYKYLCGGPGAPAFLYVRRALQESLENPVAGWFGHADQFAFAADYDPAGGVRRFLTGTPPIVSLAMVEPGVDLVLEAGLQRLREKSLRQTDYLIMLADAHLAPLGFTVATPRGTEHRGSHVALQHPQAWQINQALIDRFHVIPDFRAPDTIRLGVCPLYTTYVELHTAVTALRDAVADGIYRHYPASRQGVT